MRSGAASGRGQVAARRDMRLALLAALVAGALLPLSFAPVGFWPLAIAAPAVLIRLWQHRTPRQAARLGFAFSFGTFAVGTYWLYVSIHGFGQAPLWLALLLMLGLVSIMGLYHALLGWVVARWLPPQGAWCWLVGIPAAWLLMEWLRGWFLSGFAWLSLGYSQTDTWLAALAPVGGVYLLSAVLLLAAGALVTLLQRATTRGERGLAVAVLLLPWLLAVGLGRIEWTRPAGAAVEVAVVQGAIPQDQKWLDANRDHTLELYAELTTQALGVPLIVWPEAAAPDLANNIVPYLRALAAQAGAHGSTLVMGVVRADRPEGVDETQYFNSVLALGRELAFYDKHHLVPFAEFFPVPGFVRGWLRLMSLPYSDFTRGARVQAPLAAADLKLATTICYEDAYGSSQLPVLAEATALVNVTNDAWFGRSSARYQHLQISRMRAIEAQRYLVRAANDGVSAVIGPHGELLARAAEYEPTVLRASIVPRTGLPPYARVGNWPVVLLALVLLAFACRAARRPELPAVSMV
ncbi:MAG: apolipoprotein N-acyltransferase [Sinobacteraceae bacterium]|nr:apolipoprotein N-acyltransferase [Nevskiaceae bacterium]